MNFIILSVLFSISQMPARGTGNYCYDEGTQLKFTSEKSGAFENNWRISISSWGELSLMAYTFEKLGSSGGMKLWKELAAFSFFQQQTSYWRVLAPNRNSSSLDLFNNWRDWRKEFYRIDYISERDVQTESSEVVVDAPSATQLQFRSIDRRVGEPQWVVTVTPESGPRMHLRLNFEISHGENSVGVFVYEIPMAGGLITPHNIEDRRSYSVTFSDKNRGLRIVREGKCKAPQILEGAVPGDPGRITPSL